MKPIIEGVGGWRLLLAFVIAPLAPGILCAMFGIVYSLLWHDPNWVNGLLLVITLSAYLGYPAEILLGIPLLVVMKRFRADKFIYFALAGIFLGALIVGFFDLWRPVISSIDWYVRGAAMGLIATTTFWLIVRPTFSRSVKTEQLNTAPPD